jgi:NAD(P)-dependent dehydrogenase (short-subunit alcohol dehydrogenase family)
MRADAQSLYSTRGVLHRDLTSLHRIAQPLSQFLSLSVADLTKADDISLMIDTAHAFAGKHVDILVNNAGIQHIASVTDFPLAVCVVGAVLIVMIILLLVVVVECMHVRVCVLMPANVRMNRNGIKS